MKIEDALPYRSFAPEPFYGGRARRVGVAPRKAETLDKRFDRVVAGRPFSCLDDNVAVKIDCAGGVEQPLDIFGAANVRCLA